MTELAIPEPPVLPLSVSEIAELEECERRIEDGLESLHRIKTKGLFRHYGSWSDYMQKRWGRTERAGNQQVAAYTAISLLRESFEGTDVPIPTTEYAIRPIASLTDSPEKLAKMVEIYQTAVNMAEGKMPTHDMVAQAKEVVLGEKEQKQAKARLQIEALPDEIYAQFKTKLQREDAVDLLALADALESCDPFVRDRMLMIDMRDRALIRRLNDLYVQKRSDTAEEILTSGYLQFADDTSIKLANATARDLQRLLNEKYAEHLARAREEKQAKGEAVSTLVYNGNAERTFAALKDVLSPETLMKLADLINGETEP